MARGWTVQATTRELRCDRTRQQLFDVAIEDKDKAVEAVRHYLWARPDAHIEATGALLGGALSPIVVGLCLQKWSSWNAMWPILPSTWAFPKRSSLPNTLRKATKES